MTGRLSFALAHSLSLFQAAVAKKGEGGNDVPAAVTQMDPVAELQKECRTNMAKNIVRWETWCAFTA